MFNKIKSKQIIQWIVSIVLSIIICNCLLFFYHRYTGWIDREHSSTTSIWRPGSVLLQGIEGRGRYVVDSKGYLNDTTTLSDKYTIIIGASYTAGKEVQNGNRFSDIVNKKISKNSNKLSVYNVSQDGYYFPEIIKGFSNLNKEFPNSQNIVIEIGKVDWSEKELEDALNQRTYKEEENGENIIDTLSKTKILSMYIKENLPIYTILKTQLSKKTESQKSTDDIDLIKYSEYLDKCFKIIKKQSNSKIIILYHPPVAIDEIEGLRINKEKCFDQFKKTCEKNDIELIDMSDTFIREYKNNYLIPYGFNDTQLAIGHFNEDGHKMVANQLIPKLEDNQ